MSLPTNLLQTKIQEFLNFYSISKWLKIRQNETSTLKVKTTAVSCRNHSKKRKGKTSSLQFLKDEANLLNPREEIWEKNTLFLVLLPVSSSFLHHRFVELSLSYPFVYRWSHFRFKDGKVFSLNHRSFAGK